MKKMKKYYLMAIDLKNVDAMQILAEYYNIGEDYEEVELYYLMSIDLKNVDAMKILANYYQSDM